MSLVAHSNEEILKIVQMSGSGDEAALRKFFEIYSKDIYNFPIRVFHLSEDDASDFYIYAFERLKSGKRFNSFVGKSSFKTWFFSVLRNLLIDWQRTKRELKIQSVKKVNKDGVEYNSIEDEPDRKPEALSRAEAVAQKFQSVLHEVKLENRVIFKLSFIYYLHLDSEEIQYIATKNQLTIEDVKLEILNLREQLSDKEEINLKMEDKITSIYLNILELREQRKSKASGNSTEEVHLQEKIDHSLAKKYEQRRKLIDRKNRGHFLVRTPYREISRILGISEGGVSVTLLRVMEKIQKKFRFFSEDE